MFMHIVFLTTEYPGITKQCGGIAEYTRKISEELTNLGYEISIIVSGDNDYFKRVGKINIFVFKSLDYWKGIDGNLFEQSLRIINILINSYRFAREVNKLNQKRIIDIVQSSNYLAPSLFLNNKFPVICRLSSYAPLLREAYGKRGNIINKVEDVLELLSVKKSFRVISPSKFMKDIYSQNLKKEIIVIKTPIDDSYTNSQTTSRKEISEDFSGCRVIAYFGSLSRLKGVDLIVDIALGILKKYKDVIFLFVGRDYGIPGYGTVVKYMNEKMGKENRRVIVKDYLDRESLFSLIKNSYCCLFPSRIDNLPNACIEAISLGIPAIGSNKSSLEEMIIDGKTGYLFENSESKDLKNNIEKILKLSLSEYQEMKKNVNILYNKIQREERTEVLITYYKETVDEFKYKK